MKKIPSVFQRNRESRFVTPEVTPGTEWVLAGDGIPTRKFDGTCCMLRDGKLYKRYDVKNGKTPPTGFEPAQEPDPVTGHWPGWLPVTDDPCDMWHREALLSLKALDDGTYELCGPKIQGNPEGFDSHVLIAHGSISLENVPRDFDGLREYLRLLKVEGIVFHHPDGRMAKVKRKDFEYR